MDTLRLSCFLLISLGALVRGGQDNFFPYGTATSDQELATGNDEWIELDLQLQDDLSFPYYGQEYHRKYVQTNGILSFNASTPGPQTDNLQNNFPLNPDRDDETGSIPIIAPFWADVDTSDQRGAVYYRESQTAGPGGDLEKATTIVREDFPQYPNFQSRWVMVATWYNVSFYGRNTSSSIDPRNTFQVVLITDGEKSFVFFFYDEITWTAGTTLKGDPINGIPPYPAMQALVGFNKGDGNTFSVASFPEDRLNLTKHSNIDQPGTYAYQIDGETIIEAGCPDGGSSCNAQGVATTLSVTTDDDVGDESATQEPQGFPPWAVILIVVVFIGSAIGLLLLYIYSKGKKDKSTKKVQYSSVKSASGVYEETTQDT